MMIAIEVSTVKILRLADVDHQDDRRDQADDDGRDDRCLRLRVDPRELLAERQARCRAPSRTISRMAAVCTASVHTVTATTMQTRKILPSGPHITCSTMYCRPPLLSPICGSSRLGADITANTRMRAADHERGEDRPEDRLRRGAARLDRLLAQRAGGVEAVHHVQRGQRRDEEGAEVAVALARAVALGGEEDLRAALDVERQDDRDQHGGDQLDEHARAVDPAPSASRRAR